MDGLGGMPPIDGDGDGDSGGGGVVMVERICSSIIFIHVFDIEI